MLKREETTNPNSCLNKARDDEFIFVLLERDKVMAATIEFWANERIRLGIDREDSPKIVNARAEAYAIRSKRGVASSQPEPQGGYFGEGPEVAALFDRVKKVVADSHGTTSGTTPGSGQ